MRASRPFVKYLAESIIKRGREIDPHIFHVCLDHVMKHLEETDFISFLAGNESVMKRVIDETLMYTEQYYQFSEI